MRAMDVIMIHFLVAMLVMLLYTREKLNRGGITI